MYELSVKTKEMLEQQAKAPYSALVQMSLEEEMAHVKKVTGIDVTFSKKRKHNIFGRGNPLIARRRLRTMEDVDRGIEEVLKRDDRFEAR